MNFARLTRSEPSKDRIVFHAALKLSVPPTKVGKVGGSYSALFGHQRLRRNHKTQTWSRTEIGSRSNK